MLYCSQNQELMLWGISTHDDWLQPIYTNVDHIHCHLNYTDRFAYTRFKCTTNASSFNRFESIYDVVHTNGKPGSDFPGLQ